MMVSMSILSSSPEATFAVGQEIGRRLLGQRGLVYLTGDIGAGKTAISKGIVSGYGYPGRVTSPTFTIVNEYEGGRLPLFHFDMYRLGSADELFDIGWEDYLARGGVCAVEWSERCEDVLEEPVVRIDLRRGSSEDERIITITGAEGL